MRRIPSHTLPVSALVLLAGCGSWPLYAHIPREEGGLTPVGEDASDTVEVHWTDLGAEAEPDNDSPPPPQPLSIGEGLLLTGALDTVGWDPTVETDRELLCSGETLATEFPPVEKGTYTGDLDWLSLYLLEDGLLCATLSIDLSTDQDNVIRYDLLLYTLSACEDPLTVVLDDDGVALGEAAYASTAAWSTPAISGDRLSVLLAGYVPGETLPISLPWRLGLSVVALPAEGGSALCPSLPESL